MDITIAGIIITVLAIYFDKKTQFRHNVLPPIAFAGVMTTLGSLVL